ncbi:hypothetical protein Glove_85g143 [Diversispora epigaea]|uniref:Uncharacterized protein n=1 Tax=Diversispora epigaea TaxID=1348612 RepID=A0A397JAP5_9GLOM|nr:hypothetical protein Glove_85g143 [Diversispora epigaea]
MLEKIMKNQEKMQNDIKSVKEEVAILLYDQNCVYSVILESAQDLLEKIIYPTFDQFKETLTKKLRALQSILCARVKTSIFEVCKVPPISIVAKASKISAWKKNPAISNSFRKLFDKVEEDEKDTYMTRIIKNVWFKKKNISNLQIAWMIFIAEIILNPNNENIKISEEIIKPVLLKNLNKIENNESFKYESDSPERLEVALKRLAAPKKSVVPERPAAPRINKKAPSFAEHFVCTSENVDFRIEEDEKDTYMTRIIKNVWFKKKNISNLQIAWMIFIAEIILNPNNENIKISEEIIKPVLLKNLNKIENNESFKYESDSPERLEVALKRLAAPKKSVVPERPAAPRNEENNNDDDEADEGDKAYEANDESEEE